MAPLVESLEMETPQQVQQGRKRSFLRVVVCGVAVLGVAYYCTSSSGSAASVTEDPRALCCCREKEECEPHKGEVRQGEECCRPETGFMCPGIFTPWHKSDESLCSSEPAQEPVCSNEAWAQCGGLESVDLGWLVPAPHVAAEAWHGETCCPADHSCVAVNEWYSQCQPAECPKSQGLGATCGGRSLAHGNPRCCASGFQCMTVVQEEQRRCTAENSFDCAISTIIMEQMCLPDGTCTNQIYDQCGGAEHAVETCCPDSTECVAQNEFYSQCLPKDRQLAAATELSSTHPSWTLEAAAVCENEPFDQCGGNGYTGPSCCPDQHRCVMWHDEWYSQCRPLSECPNEPLETCAGLAFDGDDHCCQPGHSCVATTQRITRECHMEHQKTSLTGRGHRHTVETLSIDCVTTHETERAQCLTDGTCTNKVWDRCGGNDPLIYLGETCCPSGTYCKEQSEYYSQCVPHAMTPAPALV